MPAIITHDLFAKDIYGTAFESIGGTRDEAEAFLLGNQGPDPLFFVGADARYLAWRDLGSALHRRQPAELLVAFKRAVPHLAPPARSTARAYVLGFACHYLLDRTVHPLVFGQERMLTSAGVEGLTPDDRSEVHAVIETDLDELALAAKRGETVASFNPARSILKGSDAMLSIVSRLYAEAVGNTLGASIPENLFRASVRADRIAQRVLYSPSGAKRRALGVLERAVRPHSMLAALSHRGGERTETPFANGSGEPWADPFTGQMRAESFWDLYETARSEALAALATMDDDEFGNEEAHRLAADLNFYGEPVVARITAVENVDGSPAAPAKSSRTDEDAPAC